MKKIYLKSTILILTILFCFSSCKKFLDQPVPGKMSEDEFYKTDEDANQAIIAVYDILQSDYWNGGWNSMLMLKVMPSDDGNAGGANDGDQPGYQDLDKFRATPMNDKVSMSWQKCYIGIYRANKIVNKIQPENDLRKRIIAEAKVLRAYNYFDLVTLWGDVPLVTDDVPNTEYTNVGRTAKATVYKQIEDDLKAAIDVLPLKSAYSKADKFRVSKGTAQALLGKVYLYQKNWPEAVKYFNLVIDSKEYDLEATTHAAFSKKNEFGKESVFEISYSSTSNYDWGNFPWSNTPESNIHIQLWGPRADSGYEKAPGDSLLGGWGMNLPKMKLYNAYLAAGDVERRQNTVMTLVELRAAGGKFNDAGVHDFDGCFQRKYGSFASQSGGSVAELNYGTNWRFIRYADVLLMSAEANYRNNDEPGARRELRKVRDRSHLSVVTASGNALFQAIVTERQLELAFEGFRFLDLVRWDLAVQELGPLGFVKNKHELLPIPNNEVVTGKLEPNPNY